MNDLNKILDGELLSIIKTKAEAERQLTLEVIKLLQEIYSRRLHLKRGYSSLHEFCVKELKYSDGAAFRRIKAMKLVEEIPEVVDSIQSGSLNLTTASQLQSVFEAKAKEKKPMNRSEKTELINRVQNQSRREAERTIAEVCPTFIKASEKVRALNESQVKVELVIDGMFFQKIEKLKALTSYKNKTLTELLESLVDQELKRKDPELKTPRAAKQLTASPAKTNTEATEMQGTKQSRYISTEVKRYVWLRDLGQCTYMDPMTKRKCETRHNITFEHIKPHCLGGENSIENLRLLCANHNALTAITAFGKRKMESFRSAIPVKT